MRSVRNVACGVALLPALVFGAVAYAQPAGEDAVGVPSFQEGDIITLEAVDRLQPYLPPAFWANRDFFFYEGMKLEIGPSYRDYAPAEAYVAATKRFAGQAEIGPESSLASYTAGQPFPADGIDCAGDPQAGAKVIWNFDRRWNGDGSRSQFYYSYWDRGEELPLFYEGTSKTIQLSQRSEPQYLDKSGGDIFRGEKRKTAFGVEVTAPFDARGIMLMTYRYKDSEKPEAETKNDDTWVYVPTLRRVRRISSAQRTDAVSGTDFTFDDLASFSGVVPQFDWECLGEMDILAPMNTKVELRKAVKVRFIPRNPDHPYHHKDIYIDKQSMEPLYSFAYDQKEELWKIIWHNHRWSQDDFAEYQPWEGVSEPRDLRTVSDIIVNVQTGTGNRIEFWDSNGTPLRSKGKIRRYIDVGRLTKGR
jgi:hypothetical protein